MEEDPDPELVPGLALEEEGQALLPHLAPAVLRAPVVVEVMRGPKLDHTPDHVPGLVRGDVPGQAVEEEVEEEGVTVEEAEEEGVEVEEVDPVTEVGTVKAVDMVEDTVVATTE